MTAPSPPEPIRVLLIEDCPGDVFLLREMVHGGAGSRFRVVAQVDRLAAGIELMQSGGVDVVLLDLTLPDSQGLATFTRAHEAAPELPIIVLSGLDDEEFAAQTVHLGAQEYVVKGRMDMPMLQRALRYAMERAGSETELAREREMLRALLENIPDRIYFKDEQSRFIRINRALMRLFGFERPEEAYGKTDTDFYGSEHAAEALEDERRVMETGEPMFNKIEFETLVDGRRAWSLTTKLPLRDRTGRIVGTCGISREVTALMEMEDRLAAERNLLRNVIDHLPDSIFLKDAEGRYVLDNVAHFRGLGASDASEVLGRTVFDFFPGELAEAFHQNDLAIVRSGQALINHEERTFDRHGKPRWLLTTKVPWRDEGGAGLGVLCIARDVTEQKEAQENLRTAYAELAYSREEVLAAMDKLQSAHQQLRDVQLQLVEAEKMKSIGRLAAGVAHEVKNPLAVIKMGLDFLVRLEGLGDETTQLILKEMDDAVKRANLVVGGLLDYSKPRQILVQREDINAILQHTLKLVRGEMRGKCRIVQELQPDLPPLAVDSAKISQVFINLLANALQAMEQGGTLTVRTFSRQLTGVGSNIGGARSEAFRVGGQVAIVEIDDTGSGIPEEQLSKIFEPFFTTKPTGKGTGLGLSVVKTIVDLHGATIDIRNRPDGGARATLMFQV